MKESLKKVSETGQNEHNWFKIKAFDILIREV